MEVLGLLQCLVSAPCSDSLRVSGEEHGNDVSSVLIDGDAPCPEVSFASAAVGVRTCPAEGLSDPVSHLSWLWALFSQV
jgi:hypothetical protein